MTIEGCRYYAEVKGSGPTLVCFHGFAENSGTWEALQLQDCQMVLVDLLGHGRSAKPRSLEPYELPVLLGHLHELMAELGCTGYSLLGYSLGGRIALAYGAAYPREVQGLILESSAYGIGDEEQRALRREQDVRLAQEILDRGIEWFAEHWSSLPLFASQTRLPPEIRAKIRARRLGNAPHALANTLLGSGQGVFPCLREQIPTLSMPILYIHGEQDEKYKEIGQELMDLNPGIKREMIPGAGHNAHLENPVTFAEIVGNFLQELAKP
ncbi:alpha/beta hydrolase fold protein [Desulfitobacterium hafniense DCB-2]|uniref:Putative 2-succinyl-6-hydroxy-2,4-cyclohexadiene-1-carboxylate synthase n=1 Tax=Desulfitobacterium hafniense (strain DSM 10664 / DCB-2) TaxID=272564 RepID=B8FTY9_DESHD|nr:2-succinyl-6-hydroxy-2,4-cyclohexadiene-1-carboxylate synthase [Desulfitobacterium hafniense]ACL18538.1 alpha/beta hydrolase fold protein [Desulfitobacterium hafniense DCB-2]